MELTPDLRRREHDAPADPRGAEWAVWGAPVSNGKRSRAAAPALFAARSERLSEPATGDAGLERNLLLLLGASLAAHLCLLLALVLLSPQRTDAERSTETPVEVVVEQPPAREPEQKKPQQGVPPAPKAAEQKAAEQKAAEQKAAEQKAAEQKAAEQKAAEQKAAEQKAAEQKAAEQKAAEQKAAEQKAAEQKAAEQKAAEQKAAEQKAAEQKAAEQKAAEQEAAEQKAAEQKAAEQKAAEQEAAEQKAAEQKAAEQKAAEQKAGEQKAATQKAAERKPPLAESATAKANARAATQKARAQARAAASKPVDKFDQDFAGGADSSQAGLRLPFDNGPEIFKSIVTPPLAENGDVAMNYKQIVFDLLRRVQRYPESARERGARGAAVIAFTIDDAGKLTNVSLLRSSGDSDLDVESLALAARAAPFPKPPPDAQRAFAAEITFGAEVEEDDK